MGEGEHTGLNTYISFVSQGGVYRCGGLSELENKGVLLSGIGRGKELFFQRVISRVGLGGWGKRRIFSFSPFFSFPIIW